MFGKIRIILLAIVFTYCCSGIVAQIKNERIYTMANGLASDRIQGFCQDSNGMIWICTWYGLNRFDGHDFYTFRPKDSLDANSRFKRAEMANDTIYIETVSGQVISFTATDYQFHKVNNKSEKNKSRFKRIFTDSDGNIWDRVSNGIKVSSICHSDIMAIENPKYPSVRAIMEDSQHRLWVAWCGDSEDIKSEGEVCIYNLDGRLLKRLKLDYAVYSIFEDDSKNIWLGTRYEGVVVVREDQSGNFEKKHYSSGKSPEAISHDYIYEICQDSKGRIWLATLGGGINIVEDGYDINELKFHIPEKFPLSNHSRIRSLLESDGYMLIGSDNGMLMTKINVGSGDMTFIDCLASGGDTIRPATELIHIYKTEKGEVLVSSYGKGIYQYEISSGKFREYLGEALSYQQPVFSILEWIDNKYWIVAQNDLVLYTGTDGSNEYYEPIELSGLIETQPYKDSLNQCWFASKDGLIIVRSNKTHEVDNIHKVTFTEMSTFESGHLYKKILSKSDSIIRIQPNVETVSIHVSALCYDTPDKCQYYWRILEQDTIWHKVNDNVLNLPHLGHGFWTLEVRCLDRAYCREIENATLSIEVLPKWYETLLAKSLFSIIIILALCVLLWFVFKFNKIKQLYNSAINSRPVVAMSTAMINIKPEEQLSEQDNEFRKQVDAYIVENLGNEDFSIDSMSASLGMSRSVFYRRLKSIAGQTPSEYINEIKLQRAASQLKKCPNKTLSAIAYDCGFSSPQYFSNVFRKRYHMTPNEWRKSEIDTDL